MNLELKKGWFVREESTEEYLVQHVGVFASKDEASSYESNMEYTNIVELDYVEKDDKTIAVFDLYVKRII